MKGAYGRARLGAIAILGVAAFAIMAAAALTVSNAQLATAPWPMYQHDAAHTGLSQYNTSTNPGLQKWEAEIDGRNGDVDSSPVIGPDGTIYIGDQRYSDNGCPVPSLLHAINPKGAQKWTFQTAGQIVTSTPAIGRDGTIYVGDEEFFVDPRWDCQYWMPSNSNLYAVNPDGTEKWAFSTGSLVESSPAIGADGTIYFGSDDGNLYALTDGGEGEVKEKWSWPAGGSSPVIGPDGTIYAGFYDNNLYALTDNGTSATEKWALTTGDNWFSSPAISAQGTIYLASTKANSAIGSYFGSLRAVNPDGTEKWTFSSDGYVYSSPAIGADGTIYLSSSDGDLYAFTDGGQGTVTEKWAFPAGGTPAIGADGTIYAFCGDNNLCALTDGGTSATEKWAFPGAGAPAIGADGTIYFAPYFGPLYAVGTPATTISVPASLVFGISPVGDTLTKNLTLTNTGTTEPMLIGSATSSNPAEFAVGASTCPSGGSGLAPGLSCTIAIGFTPGALGARRATVTLNDNTYLSPQSVVLSGSGSATMTVSPASISIGDVKVRMEFVKSVTVTNLQTNPVSLSEGFTGPNAGDFTIVGGTCSSTLAAKTACLPTVAFAPTAVGIESATMTITDSPDPLGPYTVKFTAGATIPESVSPKALGFGSVPRAGSKTKSVTVTNNAASGSIGLNSPTTSGAADFSISGSSTCGSSLGAGANCTYAVTFAPTVETAESGALSINVVEDPIDNPSNVTTYSIALRGTGTIPESVSPKALNFGNVYQTASRTLFVTLTNKAFADGGSLTLTGASSTTADFLVTAGGTCPLPNGTLSAASCTYAVTFTPSLETAENDTLSIGVSGDPSLSVSLSGTGVTPLEMRPTSLSFSTVLRGKTSAAKAVAVYNYGAAALSLTESVGGTNPGDFAVTGGTCTTLPGGSLAGGSAHCTYLLKFTPSITGAESATLGVSAGRDTASPLNVSLTGTGM